MSPDYNSTATRNVGPATEPAATAAFAVSATPSIQAVQLLIQTRWRQRTFIPGTVLANVLRGALGITLRRLVCPDGWWENDCPPCPLYAACAYGQVFAPSPPPDATQLRRQQDLPRPFVIEPPGLHPDEKLSDEGLIFRLMLFGTAREWLPYVIGTLDRLGNDGLGRDRVPFEIVRVEACHPTGNEMLWTGKSTNVQLPQRVLTTADLLAAPWPTRPQTLPADTQETSREERPRIRLDLLTPLLLTTGSGIDPQGRRIPAQDVRDRPPFGVIVRRLRDRLSSLCTFFGTPWRHPDFASIGALADRVTLLDSRTCWLTRNRRSTRTGQSHEISGLVGYATYEFPDEATFTALAPLLRLGELIHVGKHAPWGNGAIRITRLEDVSQ